MPTSTVVERAVDGVLIAGEASELATSTPVRALGSLNPDREPTIRPQ